MGLKYCCYNQQSGCYIEFQRGDFNFHNCFWLSDSLFLSDDIANRCHLATLFAQVLPSYNCYGPTKVLRSEWDAIKSRGKASSAIVQEIIDEIDMWAQQCFMSETCFTILGI